MSINSNHQTYKKINYKALAMIICLCLGLATDSIPFFFIVGLSIGIALDKRYQRAEMNDE